MVNDISIITGIITVFVLTGILLPFVGDAFGAPTSLENVQNFVSSFGDDVRNVKTNETVTGILGTFSTGAKGVGFLDVLFSVASMFFWSFGVLPFWLEAIFFVLRAALILIVARNIWIGGGG